MISTESMPSANPPNPPRTLSFRVSALSLWPSPSVSSKQDQKVSTYKTWNFVCVCETGVWQYFAHSFRILPEIITVHFDLFSFRNSISCPHSPPFWLLWPLWFLVSSWLFNSADDLQFPPPLFEYQFFNIAYKPPH